jgi:exosome complex component RRP43
LYQHLVLSPSTRPSGRSPSAFPTPTLNASPLTHCFGSCVARSGDTAAVAGIRAEILDAKSVPNPPADDDDDTEKIRKLGLLVPNVEFATGSGKKWLPGGAPGISAQSITFKVLDLLLSLELIDLKQLEIRSSDPSITELSTSSSSDSDSSSDSSSSDSPASQQQTSNTTVIGYWTLYIDITLISSAGTLLPTIWAALLGALHTTHLPHAYRSPTYPDTPIVCSSMRAAVALSLRGTPVVSTFAVFEPRRHKGLAAKSGGSGEKKGEWWVLAEPDELEEEVCNEEVVVVVDCSDKEKGTRIRRAEKSGGSVLGRSDVMDEVFALATARWGEWNAVLEEISE